MSTAELHAITPVDGRYRNQTEELSAYTSEYALFRYRLFVEAEYLIAFMNLPFVKPSVKTAKFRTDVRSLYKKFNEESAGRIKEIEKTVRHDVKAVELYMREKMEARAYTEVIEWIHFGLTSQDINNTAIPLMLRDAHSDVLNPLLIEINNILRHYSTLWIDVPMLAHTHGQPASPTFLGKEFRVFSERMDKQIRQLNAIPFSGKFGGATGNMNAHYVAYPAYNWHGFAENFLKKLGLERQSNTTQIEHYDGLAAYFDAMKRINTVLLDLCRDVWLYISLGYFRLKTNPLEVGSSTMPHKVNPIDFENAEGNLGLANALFLHFSSKLPVSRLQRDLSDSTVTRSFGTALGHTVIALKSIISGLNKITPDADVINAGLDNNWQIITEALQTVLRREGYRNPYDALKNFSRSSHKTDRESIHAFIDSLDISASLKKELKKISPRNYTGKANYKK